MSSSSESESEIKTTKKESVFEIIKPPNGKVLNFSGMIMKPFKPKDRKVIINEQSWVEKYRPRLIHHIVSHKNILDVCNEIIKDPTKSFPHMIFFGPPGTGKTSTILAIARELFGDKFKERVFQFNASDDRGICAVREKIKSCAEAAIYKDPHSKIPPYKLIILDEADALTQDAQSALRIIIEDNAKNTRFILICNYITNIFGQIISRCTKFRFNPIDDKLIENRLVKIAKKENIYTKLSSNVIPTIIKIINGDLRTGITMLQRCVVLIEIHKKIKSKHILETVGIISTKKINKFMISCKTLSDTFNIANNIIRRGYSIMALLENIINVILEDIKLKDSQKAQLCLSIAISEKKLIEGANELGQLTYILILYYKEKYLSK